MIKLLLKTIALLIVVLLVWKLSIQILNPKDKIDYAYTYHFADDTDKIFNYDLSEKLPHDIYQHKKDSLEEIKTYYTDYMKNIFGQGISWSGLGVLKIMECDTCTPNPIWAGLRTGNVNVARYYLLLPDYQPSRDTLRERGKYFAPIFFGKLAKPYKRYLKIDSLPNRNGMREYWGHWQTELLPYRLKKSPWAISNTITSNNKDILIPISKTAYMFLRPVNIILLVIYVSIMFRFWLINFILLLVDLAKGNAFTVKNYNRLFYAAGTLAFFVFGNLLIKLLAHAIYRNYYSRDFDIYIDWESNIKNLLICFAIWLLAKAFKKGFNMKNEQDLTI